jgi:hypothetical protein
MGYVARSNCIGGSIAGLFTAFAANDHRSALQVEVNEEKSRIVDLGRGDSFGFLGSDSRRIRSGRGVWRAQFTPKLKKRTALLRKLKEIFRRHRSQPVNRVIQLINPILRRGIAFDLNREGLQSCK